VFAHAAADRIRGEIVEKTVFAGTVKLVQEMITRMGRDWNPELI
jgi:hypothetical protein